MSDGGADIGVLIGVGLGTSIGFILCVYYVHYKDVFISNMGSWEG